MRKPDLRDRLRQKVYEAEELGGIITETGRMAQEKC